jgi:hypothetical protein
MNTRRMIGSSLAAGCALLLGLSAFRCGEQAPASEPQEPAAAAGAEAPAPLAATAAPPAQHAPDASVAAGREERPRADNPVARSMAQHDAHDRALLGELERMAHPPPPAAVFELLALRRQGKPRDELARFISEHLSADMAARVALARWLDTVTGNGNGGTAPAATDTPLGQGGNPRQVQPLLPRGETR